MDRDFDSLALDDYRRYGRQMILDGFGLSGKIFQAHLLTVGRWLLDLIGQLKLQQASVVVVGAGGLGCPALQYLAAAGIGASGSSPSQPISDVACTLGRIGIIDHDVVEVSNLQRQILHNERTVGMRKTESAAQAIRK